MLRLPPSLRLTFFIRPKDFSRPWDLEGHFVLHPRDMDVGIPLWLRQTRMQEREGERPSQEHSSGNLLAVGQSSRVVWARRLAGESVSVLWERLHARCSVRWRPQQMGTVDATVHFSSLAAECTGHSHRRSCDQGIASCCGGRFGTLLSTRCAVATFFLTPFPLLAF